VSERQRLLPAYFKQESGAGQQQTNKEKHGWDAYRKWLSRGVTQSPVQRTPLDRSVYSWRGYHTWADKIRRSWDDGKA
jgi:hypothetical protein